MRKFVLSVSSLSFFMDWGLGYAGILEMMVYQIGWNAVDVGVLY